MLKTFQVLSRLLDYPSKEVMHALDEALAIVASEGILNDKESADLVRFMTDVAQPFAQKDDLRSWQAQYSGLFDTSTHENLYLFDFVYGESRDRGQAMVDLKEAYTKTGLEIGNDELPDYLPVFLEFAALQPSVNDAFRLLAEVKPVLTVMEQKFQFRSHPYAPLISLIYSLSQRGATL